MDKVVRLERVNDTFGFSVFGGARTTLPPVVCEVTPGGPADLCGQVRLLLMSHDLHMIITVSFMVHTLSNHLLL